ncbi:MAG: hypothetical protein GX045_11195 [Clostridiaceae bacterium]|nr:hypothetical protein [Clostridiaceae bacterium]
MNKKTIIDKVNEISNHPVFLDAVSGNNFGNTQFRTLCEMSNRAECIEELELLIDYKTAKGNGWNIYKNGKTLGQLIKEGLIELTTKQTAEKPDEMRKNKIASLYFGYLHWKATEIKKRPKSNN